MAFLRTLFWIVITAIVVVFSVHNWVPVTISLFGDLQADVKLPVLLLIAFLVGFVPVYIWHHAYRWRQKRKYSAVERAPAPIVQTPPQPSYAQTPSASHTATSDPFRDE